MFKDENSIEIYAQNKKIHSHKLEGYEFSETLSSIFDQGDNLEKPYLPQNFRQKCLLKVVKNGMFEIMLLEIYEKDVKIIWSQRLPG